MKNASAWEKMVLRRQAARVCAALPACPEADAPGSEAWQAWLEGAMTQALAPYAPVGAAIAMAWRGQVVAVHCQGEAVIGGAVVQPDTLFRVASVSKLIGSMAVMRLVSEGRLALDADIGAVLGFPVRPPRYPEQALTLRQLMTHTAGLVDSGDYDRTVGTPDMLPLSDMLARKENYAAEPGRVFRYCNFGVGIAGAMVEAVSGRILDDYCQATLFAPLGITASFHPQRLPLERLANCYRVPGRELGYDAPAIAAQPLDTEANAMLHYATLPGKLMITAQDALRLLLCLLSGGDPLISADAARGMCGDQGGMGSVHMQVGRGLNVAIAPGLLAPGRELLGHQGNAYGAICGLWGDPADGSGIAVLTNGADGRHCGPASSMVQAAVATYYHAVDAWTRKSK